MLSKEIIEKEGWIMYENTEIYASFRLPNGSDLLWWKGSNCCEMDSPDSNIGYRGNIPNAKALRDLMSWTDITQRC